MTTYEATWLGTGHAALDNPDDVEPVRAPIHAAGHPVVAVTPVHVVAVPTWVGVVL